MYEKIKLLDGRHPWRDVSADGYVDYPVRSRAGGHVIYFNYALGRELDLIPANHIARMDTRLERALLDTFALQIVNEYDQQQGGYDAGSVRPQPCMATRYLQAQHKDKRGRTSGDGRAIWNGLVKTRTMTFDVSSRGTGATRLSPGAQVAGVPVKTGDASYGYSCGRADLDEMLGTALMSEIFYRSGLPTERTLCVIEFGDGTAIGVRTAPNLVRPAHIFRYLKQGRRAETKASLDYFIARQEANGFWKLPSEPRARYRKVLRYLARSYGKLAAVLEEEYIFNWLAWDGDNMLASGAILDYGSIRQFAAKHDKYRYDDVDRFSSSLTEQRHWARETVKVFAQAVRFIMTGRKLNLRRFKQARCLEEFDRSFDRERDRRLLWRIGFAPAQISRLLKRGRPEVRDLRQALAFFEDQKVARGVEKLDDGITHSPVFLIRSLLRRLPEFYIDACRSQPAAMMPSGLFCKIMAASYASRTDLKMTAARAARAEHFQRCYQRLLARAGPYEQILRTVRQRCAVINHEHRMTGDAILYIVAEIMNARDKLGRDELQSVMDAFIGSQVLVPGEWKPIERRAMEGTSAKAKLLRAIQQGLEVCKETV
ncbi:MAG TPA: protein adenylyltransferase SelO family protein [Tepidisphaeraceae bacterium]|nr:protein adenylyltransferase SelO family protein [Tepidisphaeraceae bacterium]